eukprot:PhF_6_TR22695/c0_g1_i1/m.32318
MMMIRRKTNCVVVVRRLKFNMENIFQQFPVTTRALLLLGHCCENQFPFEFLLPVVMRPYCAVLFDTSRIDTLPLHNVFHDEDSDPILPNYLAHGPDGMIAVSEGIHDCVIVLHQSGQIYDRLPCSDPHGICWCGDAFAICSFDTDSVRFFSSQMRDNK